MVGPHMSIPLNPLDPRVLDLQGEEKQFFQTLTGIEDDEELKEHIINIAVKACMTFPYPCIHGFAFTKFKISRLSAYSSVLQLAKSRPGAILLDAACCFGNDLRKAVLDGWPAENTMGFDLESEFWQCGHELFKSTPQSFPAGFVGGDAFDSEVIKLMDRDPYAPPNTPRPANLRELTSLTPLQGHVSAIHASSFFHLFDDDHQSELARRLASLLSPEPGSIIFGYQRGLSVKKITNNLLNYPMTCHSPESWKNLWDGRIFKPGTVRVHAELKPMNRKDVTTNTGDVLYYLDWSVTMLGAGQKVPADMEARDTTKMCL